MARGAELVLTAVEVAGSADFVAADDDVDLVEPAVSPRCLLAPQPKLAVSSERGQSPVWRKRRWLAPRRSLSCG